jgi:hypothetical protein
MNDEQIKELATNVISWGSPGGTPNPSAEELASAWVEGICEERGDTDDELDEELQRDHDRLLAELISQGVWSER